ncbi:3-keto-5-aminohexanoate cleavage protein [uncultured Cohaesibacter sp.]|uniref:3-keto-5-aminohexanoate cleavage protein n=1 Tax=uncultured Cohaesibacter sp. TaxID=1002546 RepID=UPI0029C8DE9A|nr:3-keto-5-aminohexanoate cleavage protein [uncultured Cohaesibacter sp.]
MSLPDYTYLPKIMLAPNGARRTKADHPALPVTISETVEAARSAFEAGADGLHTHVRDEHQRHCLDAGLYRELLSELALVVPDMFAQITTEAVGRYSPLEQRDLVRAIEPRAVSIGLREMTSEGDTPEVSAFYHEQRDRGVAIQHILYDVADVDHLTDACASGLIPADGLQLLFVLGRYTTGQQSSPSDLDPFMSSLARLEEKLEIKADWSCCAFGQGETDCLLRAMALGGKVRIGFENNLFNQDGSLATSNTERVRDLIRAMEDKP